MLILIQFTTNFKNDYKISLYYEVKETIHGGPKLYGGNIYIYIYIYTLRKNNETNHKGL